MAPPTKQWIPLESNPDILTKFGRALGLPSSISFTDVWSLDLLDMVPRPCYAVLLLFPLTERLIATQAAEKLPTPPESQSAPFFCKQTISNACGTVALLHASLNADISLTENSFLDDFRTRTLGLDPDQRADALHDSSALDAVHTRFATEGQTAVPSDLNNLDMHFVCFAHHNGGLYQLDGRKGAPIYHGATTADNILSDTGSVIKKSFMEADPTEHRFTIVALTANPE